MYEGLVHKEKPNSIINSTENLNEYLVFCFKMALLVLLLWHICKSAGKWVYPAIYRCMNIEYDIKNVGVVVR